MKPSESVVLICQETEKCVLFMLKLCYAICGKLPGGKCLEHIISSAVLAIMSTATVFMSLSSHMFDTAADENHVHALVKVISACFTLIRLHHLGSIIKEEAIGDKVRKQLSKLILFKHQQSFWCSLFPYASVYILITVNVAY